ncbi:MAG: heterodisulfide reductase-related iron-sulfur binding cluster [Chloroflexi bacterium]|nr:heterodisulfide reductase-related iron-sulfur binding cluster [Chloroflexota bacterium]MCL5110814.1 heterodisulfide reductase-related iron-sulfur binding cluster [Chloroflexota bacterium]
MAESEEVLQLDEQLAKEIEEVCGENAYLCYQCRKCTAGCPLSEAMDLAPNQVVRAIQLGQTDLVFDSTTIWLCSGCETCVTRCPQRVDLPKMMDALRRAALKAGHKPKLPAVANFYNAASRDIKLAGRLPEVYLMAELNLRNGNLFKDMDLAWELFKRGKINVLPEFARAKAPDKPRPMPVAEDEIAYYPGCSSHGTAREFDESTRAVAAALGVNLVEPEGWVCCGSSAVHATSHELATEMPLRNLALVAAGGHDAVTTPCASCFSRFKTAIYDLNREEELRGALKAKTGYEYRGEVAVEHLIDTFANRVGYDKVRATVKQPLAGLKVVAYYGCLLTRPKDVTGAADAEYPLTMDRLLRAAGAEVLDWSYKTECCGASLALSETQQMYRLTDRILDNAQAVGAEAVVVACPLCQSNLDARQPQINKALGRSYRLPILYFTEALGLAFGLSPRQLGLQRHVVDVNPLLAAKGLAPAAHA